MELMGRHQELPVNLAIDGSRAEQGAAVGAGLAGPIRVELTGANIWRDFHREGNEMIITKSGRNLFPKLKVRLHGLQMNEPYTVVLEMRLATPRRFKYSNNRWVDAGEADSQSDELRTYVQTVMPSKNATWCDVDMKNAKISNSPVDGRGNIVLSSMHKYIPYLHVIRGADMHGHSAACITTVFFPETEFIAVTAYQNDEITRMKIANNPFAKGFRETGKAKCRRNQRHALQSPTTVLQGAKEVLEMMQDARRGRDGRDDAASPMSSACSTSSTCSTSKPSHSASHSEGFAFPGLPTPPSSRTPTPPLSRQSFQSTLGFSIDDILYGNRYSARRSLSAPAVPAPAALPVHPLYHLVYAPMPVPSWIPYPGVFPHAGAGLAPLPSIEEAYYSYPTSFKQEYS